MSIGTCARSLIRPGYCCHFGCVAKATTAVLTDMPQQEHTWCDFHVDQANTYGTPVQAIKPLIWDPLWGPKPTTEKENHHG